MTEKKRPKIEKAGKTGFCFGVRRAINTLEKVAKERGGIETLGAVVHNQQVLQKMAEIGVRVVDNIDDIRGNAVVTSSHGITPEMEEKIKARHSEVISTTCPNVHRAQSAAKKLAESDFFIIVYGDAGHPEVRGILGWAKGKGLATTDETAVAALDPLPRRLGILSQTTQVPARFAEFVKKIIDLALTKNSEIHVIDTICHDLRERQAAALELAHRVDLMLVVGGRSSANTNRLAELCAQVTETHLIETAEEINPAWLKGKKHIGVTSGASTAEETVDEVMKKLEEMA
ncbi:MAG: 4-hydroxy-3-methylbut-2-enyl diphosphate reductase [Chloroflexi bacterium RBG_13_52_12]|nr:MAG: 4-hydroxy-3-methylbut-2-enyl diphosphate reductase [Chloroflexi bacterium RBG_13_52_12]